MSRTKIPIILVHRAMRLVGLSAVVVLPVVSAAEARLSSPVASVSIARSFGDKPSPKWENGFLVAFDPDQVPAIVQRARKRMDRGFGLRVDSWALERRRYGVAAGDKGRRIHVGRLGLPQHAGRRRSAAAHASLQAE